MSIQEKLEHEIATAFEVIRKSKADFYSQNPAKKPTPAEVDRLINACVRNNAVVSGSLNLIPGPLGMAALIPELVIIMKNQISMIYDIGLALGKEKQLTTELLLGVVLSAMGTSSGGLLVMHGSKVVVKRSSLQVVQKMVRLLAGNILQKTAKSFLGKLVPVLGAAALATWSGYSTKRIGKRAVDIFSQEIEFDQAIVVDDTFEAEGNAETETSRTEKVEIEKIKILLNLSKVDKEVHFMEKEYLETLISNCTISNERKSELLAQLDSLVLTEVNYAAINENSEDTISLLMDMVTLAQKDGKLHPVEKLYIKKVAEQLNLEKEIVDELLAISFEPASV